MVIEGVLIAESLRVGRALDAVPLTVTTIRRVDAPGEPGPGRPTHWTLIDFEAPDDAATRLADALHASLQAPDHRPEGGRDQERTGTILDSSTLVRIPGAASHTGMTAFTAGWAVNPG